MYVSMIMCAFVHTNMCIYSTHTCVCMFVYIDIHTCIYLRAYNYLCIYMYMYIYTHTYHHPCTIKYIYDFTHHQMN